MNAKLKRDGHGKLRNGRGKVMNKYFVKSVGTLIQFSNSLLHFHMEYVKSAWGEMIESVYKKKM